MDERVLSFERAVDLVRKCDGRDSVWMHSVCDIEQELFKSLLLTFLNLIWISIDTLVDGKLEWFELVSQLAQCQRLRHDMCASGARYNWRNLPKTTTENHHFATKINGSSLSSKFQSVLSTLSMLQRLCIVASSQFNTFASRINLNDALCLIKSHVDVLVIRIFTRRLSFCS